MNKYSIFFHFILLCCANFSSYALEVNLPPTANLLYTIKAKQSGFPLSGSATVKWQTQNGLYQITSETRAKLIGKILDANSKGAIDTSGLAPEQFYEKRFGKEATNRIEPAQSGN